MSIITVLSPTTIPVITAEPLQSSVPTTQGSQRRIRCPACLLGLMMGFPHTGKEVTVSVLEALTALVGGSLVNRQLQLSEKYVMV